MIFRLCGNMNNLSVNYGKSSLYHDISYDTWTKDHNTIDEFLLSN